MKGQETYIEGRLRLASWQGNDGAERHGLNMTCWTVTPMGSFGRNKASTNQQQSRPMGAAPQRSKGSYQGIDNGQQRRQPASLPY